MRNQLEFWNNNQISIKDDIVKNAVPRLEKKLLEVIEQNKKLIEDKIAANKRSMVWIYAPGYSNEKSLSKNFIEEVTQIKMQELTLSDAVTIEMDSAITPNKKFSVWNNAVNPLFVANDDKVEVLGTINGTNNAGFVKKQLKNHMIKYLC